MASYIGNSQLYRRTIPEQVLNDYKTKVEERFITNEVTGYEITFNDIADGEYGYIGIYIDLIKQGAQNEDIYSIIVAWKMNSDSIIDVYNLSYKIAECLNIPNNFYIEDNSSSVRSYIMVEQDVSLSFTYDEKKTFTMLAVLNINAVRQKS